MAINASHAKVIQSFITPKLIQGQSRLQKAQNQPSKLSFTIVAPRVRAGEAMDQPKFPPRVRAREKGIKTYPKFYGRKYRKTKLNSWTW